MPGEKTIDLPEGEYLNEGICAACGGECCASMPGSSFPEDWEPDIEQNVRDAIESGKWAVDWWEGDPRVGSETIDRAYYVRPATKGNEGRIFDPAYRGACTFWDSEKGCMLPFEKRPKECRTIEPHRNSDECMSPNYNKRTGAVAWLPYRAMFDSMNAEGAGGPID